MTREMASLGPGTWTLPGTKGSSDTNSGFIWKETARQKLPVWAWLLPSSAGTALLCGKG